MTDTERLAHDAQVPADLAAIVVMAALRAGVSVRRFRSQERPRWLWPYRHSAVYAARLAGFQWVQIGRAMNRDHACMIRAYRREMSRRSHG